MYVYPTCSVLGKVKVTVPKVVALSPSAVDSEILKWISLLVPRDVHLCVVIEFQKPQALILYVRCVKQFATKKCHIPIPFDSHRHINMLVLAETTTLLQCMHGRGGRVEKITINH